MRVAGSVKSSSYNSVQDGDAAENDTGATPGASPGQNVDRRGERGAYGTDWRVKSEH